LTELLYLSDGYLQQFNARILNVDWTNGSVTLDKSAFYPGGGGQPCDQGYLFLGGEKFRVEQVKKQGDEVLHFIRGDMPTLENGLEVKGVIDWERRFSLMRTHSAMHVLCSVVFRDYGASVTGGEMDVLKGRMDFEFESLKAELVKVIEDSVNREIKAGHTIIVKTLPREEAFKIPNLIRTKINLLPEGIRMVRTVEIEGLDLQADGGTHLSNTSEIGQVKVVDYKSKGAINKRIYVEIT